VLVTWYAQGDGKYNAASMWNDDSFGGGSFGTPAAGDTVDSNGHTIELNTIITGIFFSTSSEWRVVSGDTATLRGCTFDYSLRVLSGGSLVIDKTAPVTDNNTYFRGSGNFTIDAGGSFVVNAGCVVQVQTPSTCVSNENIEVNGSFVFDCASAQVCVQFATGKAFVGVGLLTFYNVSSNYTTAPFLTDGTFNLTLLAGGGGADDPAPVGRSSGV
jgi:hypothetical protein